MNFKRFVVRDEGLWTEKVSQMLDSMELIPGIDYVRAGTAIYFDTAAARTMFILKYTD